MNPPANRSEKCDIGWTFSSVGRYESFEDCDCPIRLSRRHQEMVVKGTRQHIARDTGSRQGGCNGRRQPDSIESRVHVEREPSGLRTQSHPAAAATVTSTTRVVPSANRTLCGPR